MIPVLISTITDKVIPAFGWMLIHSLWEGLLFAIITGAVLMLAKKAGAAVRYNIVLVLFAAFIGICAFTFILELDRASATTLKPLIPGGDGTLVPALFFGNIHSIKQFVKIFTDYFAANEPLVVMVWFVFFLFKSVKMFACLVYNQQIRHRQVIEPSEFWAGKVVAFAEKLQIKRAVKLLQSGYIKMPVVVGHLKPVILIPIGLMAGLPFEQVEAILLHELAHIRRNDYFVNFLQNIAEAVFFFNPGLLWISSLLREERENCCDDIALAQTQNKVGFVQALISFKEHELYGSDYAVAFPGKKNYLLRRVSRIISNKNMAFGFGERIFLVGSILIFSVFVTAASVAQIKEYAKIEVVKAKTVLVVQQKAAMENDAIVKALKTEIKHARIKARQKMRNGISSIREKIGAMAAISTIVPAVAAEPPVNNMQELSEKDQGEKDKVQARSEQEQGRIDQLQAIKDQQQALKDQAQAKIDQAEALKDQAQARIDRVQAKTERRIPKEKDQIKPDKTQEQITRNEEQVRLNQMQVNKNHDQAVRNEQQARLNKIQEKKNEQQAVRNEEQARLNQIQEKKNEEQAVKNNVSVQ
jgi:bla regulator protein BlaR1